MFGNIAGMFKQAMPMINQYVEQNPGAQLGGRFPAIQQLPQAPPQAPPQGQPTSMAMPRQQAPPPPMQVPPINLPPPLAGASSIIQQLMQRLPPEQMQQQRQQAQRLPNLWGAPLQGHLRQMFMR